MVTTIPTQSEPEASYKNNFESDLALEFLRVVEEAAIASGKTMGQGDRELADQVATEAMRGVMDSVPMDGTIVIGEGERDEAPMLYIGEKVGKHDGGSLPRGRHRRRSAGRHQPVRYWIARRYHRAGGLRARRPAARARLLHGEDRRRPVVQRRRRSRSACRPQPGSHRQGAGPQGRRPGHHHSRPSAARKADRRDSQGRRPHSPYLRRRSLSGRRRRPCWDRACTR